MEKEIKKLCSCGYENTVSHEQANSNQEILCQVCEKKLEINVEDILMSQLKSGIGLSR